MMISVCERSPMLRPLFVSRQAAVLTSRQSRHSLER